MDGTQTLPSEPGIPRPAIRLTATLPVLRLCVPPAASAPRADASPAATPELTKVGQAEEGAPSTRRLMFYYLRCIGIALVVLAFAIAAVAAPTDENQVIVPGGQGSTLAAPSGATGSGAFTAIAVILLAGVGAWLVWRGRAGKLGNLNRQGHALAIEETRSLGNRQYLVVAAYQDKKFLLGVCPGRIDLLAPLHDGAAPLPPKERA